MKRKFILLSALCMGLGFTSFAQLSQDFESTTGTALPSGWTQTSSTTGWVTGTNSSLSSNGYPVPAHTRFVGINDDADSSTHNTSDMLKTPVFSLSGVTGAYLAFDLDYLGGSYGGFSESFSVQISTDGGTTWNTLQTISGNTVAYWEPRHISLAAFDNMSNLMLGFKYSDGGGWEYGVAMDNINVYVPPVNEMSLDLLTPTAGSASAYGAANGTINLGGTVTNNGSATISSFNFNYQIGSQSVVSTPISSNINPFGSYTFSVQANLPGSITNNIPVKAWVSLSGDANAANDSGSTAINTVPFMPFKRVMVEEGTGSWCGWCVRGIVWMDSLRELYPEEANIVAVHDANNYDVMATENTLTTHYDQWISSKISGYPSVLVDRATSGDPSDILGMYNGVKDNFGFASLWMESSVSNGSINTKVSVMPAIDMSGDYRLELVVSEDDVTGSAPGYAQHNYYSSQVFSTYGQGPGSLTGQGNDYYNLPYSITGVHFMFVDRYTIPDMSSSPNGVANSLPANMTAQNTYVYNFDPITIASDWNPANLHVTVMLIDNNSSSPNFGHVLNSVKTRWAVGVQNVSAGISGVTLYPNPANEVANLNFNLEHSSTVNINVTDAIGRTVYSMPSTQMNAGAQKVSIPTASFAAGVYNVTLSTEKGNTTQRLSIVK